ncbi:MAG: type II secretion system F family protein, partial [Desulfobacterales bacterium]
MAEAAIKQNVFTWEGTDKKGKKVKGETNAANPSVVKADLRRQGIKPLKVSKKSALFANAKKKKILAKDIAVFMRQLATMMSAGVPLVQSFEIIGRGHENPSMQELVLTIKAEVESGSTLANALGKHPLYFDELVCNLVVAGEQAGILEGLLDKIATYKEKTEALKAKIKKALTYPIAVIIVAFVVTAILLIFVVPTFQELFEGFGADLPAFTQMVVNLSEWMQANWWIALLAVVGIVYGFSQAKKRSPRFAHALDRIMLKVPIVGEILTKAIIARYARTLSTMFAAGVPLVEAMESV